MFKKYSITLILFFILTFVSSDLLAKSVKYSIPAKPFKNLFSMVSKGPVDIKNNTVSVPFITWAGDGPMILSNGGKSPNSESFFAQKAGFKVKMENGDNFKKQVENYIQGKTPFLRGTLGMINLAAEVLSEKDPALKPLVFIKYSWSEGADGLVGRKHIKKVKDLKGKTIVLQKYSPHLEFLEQVLGDAGLTTDDVNIKFVSEIIEPPGGETKNHIDPANAFRFDKSVDAAFCISPDIGNLTSGATVGTGAEGSVKGAHLVVTTKTAKRVIADVLAVRSDFAKSNPEMVMGIAAGVLKGLEKLKKVHSDSSAYDSAVSIISKVLLDDENPLEVKGMLTEVNLSDYTENYNFFEKSNNPVGFSRLNRKYQGYLVKNGYTTKKVQLAHLSLDKDFLSKNLDSITVEKRQKAFKSMNQAKKILKKVRKTKTQGSLFEYTFYFQPNETKFNPGDYEDIFKRIHELSETYGGALVNIIGHGDPSLINRMKKEGSSKAKLRNTMASSKRMTYKRALGVKRALQKYAENKDLEIDETQFVPSGEGIGKPLFPVPRSEKEWRQNMRVEVKIINIESEATSFPGWQK
ncbi:hypothetical protein ACFL35_11815 [Candidatus Riflebacteria bacterium]